jgi:1-acyl-sn-glycerol-3-phosphate acyltransferase
MPGREQKLQSILTPLSKVVGFFGRAARFISVASVARQVIRDPRRQRCFAIGAVSRTAAGMLGGFGIRVRAVHLPSRPPAGKAYFVVANHASDIDIPVLASVLPVVFLAAADVGETAFVGTLVRLGGVVFVERRRRSELRDELKKVRQILEEGFDTALFPEGRTSNGVSVQPFKSALFQAAIDAEALLLPVCINYLSVGGEPLSAANRDQVLYYGDMGFSAHLRRLLAAGTIEVECRFLSPIPLAKGDSRKAIAQRARHAILEQHRPVR